MKIKHLFGLIFCGTLLFFGYNLYVFGALAKIDEQFEINTRFKENDLNNWLAPQRTQYPLTRWRENRTTGIAHANLKSSALHQCILSDKPCVQMLEDIAPERIFWKTGTDILTEQQQIRTELIKLLQGKKIKDINNRPITSAEHYRALLEQEEYQIKQALDALPWHYRICIPFYNLWNYSPMVLFTFLHYSHLIAALPMWVKDKLNTLLAWYMEGKYQELKEETKKAYKKKTFWFFHSVVESRVEKAFKKLQNKATQHTYIHDYSPYYRKLRYDFDLEVKNIYQELERLYERNQALQEIVQPSPA